MARHLGDGLFLVILTGCSGLAGSGFGTGFSTGGKVFFGINSGTGFGGTLASTGTLAATGTFGGPAGLKSIFDTFFGGAASVVSKRARASATDGIFVSSSGSISMGTAMGSGFSSLW